MDTINSGIEFDPHWIQKSSVNQPAIENFVRNISHRRAVKKEWQVSWLLRAVTCIDLTTLSGDDSFSNVQRLCFKAAHPVQEDLLSYMGISSKDVQVAAVCVYPSRVQDCKKVLESIGANIPIAAVATGFPSGQYPLKSRLLEIDTSISDGAKEIDIVINRDLALCGQWEAVYQEVKMMREACGKKVHLKTILATGELGSLSNVYKASLVCMMAGADFIKTSTGKEAVNATLPVGTVMTRAIRDYYEETGVKVGFKPAGGIRTAKDALLWQILMKEVLDDQWLFPNLFRFGASGLLGDIERQIYHYVTGCYASSHVFPLS